MTYEKQTWNKYDDLKTEEENIENGAVVTDNRMNHIEEGIEAHTADLKNPHSVTAAQVGLGNVQNFGLATEDEAKQGISNAKYMTPSLTQAVLSANINSIAYANSANGADGFTTVYPNLNLLKNTKSQSYTSTGTATNNSSNIYPLDGNVADILNKPITITYDYTITNSSGTWSGSIRPTYGLGGTNQSVSSTKLSGTCKETVTLTAVSQSSYGILTSGLPTGAKVTITNLKVEFGLTATPYISSASEVTTADWPKYVGFSNTVKTNKSASDYTWFPVKDSELTNKVDSHVNNKANPHSVTASQVGAYTKSETDAKFKVFNDLIVSQDIPEGANLDDYKKEGEFSKKTPTVVTGVPEGVTGAFRLSVRSMVGSSGIFQTLYDYATRGIYYRVGNTSLGFNLPWQRIANNSEVVHLTGDETIEGKKTFTNDMVVKNIEVTGDYKKSTDTEMINLPLSGVATATVSYQRKNGVVFVKGGGNWGNFEANKSRIVGTLPVGFRPPVDWPSGMNAMGGSQSMSVSVGADGRLGITCDIKKDGVYGGFSMSFPVE